MRKPLRKILVQRTNIYLLAALLFCSISFLGIPRAWAMPAPTLQQLFQYDPSETPVLSDDPASAKPVGVGSAAAGGDTLSLQVGLNELSGPVDIYFALYAPSIDADNLYLLKSDYTFQTAAQGLAPWKTNSSAPVTENLGDIPLTAFPKGTYNIYLVVSQPGSLQSYYIWQTSFSVDYPTLPVPAGTNWFTYSEIPLPIESVNPADARPIGFGSGFYTKDLRIDTVGYSGPVDVYVALIGPSNPTSPLFFQENGVCQLSTAGFTIQTAIQAASQAGSCKFRDNTTASVQKDYLQNATISLLWPGTYKYYFVVTPHIVPYSGTIVDDYYLWETSFVVPMSSCTYTYGSWGACQPNGTQTRTLISSSPVGCTGTPVLTQTCTYVPPPPPAGPSEITNKQWINGIVINPGGIKYYYLNAATSIYSLMIMLESSDTTHTNNVDMLVKYVGPVCNDSLKPTMDEYNQVLAGCPGGVTCTFTLNGYTFYMNHSKDSYETIQIPHNASGCYYVMLYDADISTNIVNLGASW